MMNWPCPHCGNKLYLSADQLPQQGWAFTCCIKCSGFALVRHGASNIIKVNSAPPGESVLIPRLAADLPKADITTILQPDGTVAAVAAAAAPSVNTSTIQTKPQIKPVQRRSEPIQTREEYAREAAHFAQMAAATESQADQRAERAAAFSEVARKLSGKMVPFPMPLPEPPHQNERMELMPVMVGLVAAVIVAGTFIHFI